MTPFSERGSAVLLDDIAAVEVAVLVEDAMRLKDAASCSFDCFNIDLKERLDDTVTDHVGGQDSGKSALDVLGHG